MPAVDPPVHRRGPGIRSLTEPFWRLLFPPRCLACDTLLPPSPGIPLCRPCRVLFSPAGMFCPRCGRNIALGQPCGCSVEAFPLQGLFALSWYEGAWRRMLHRFKFEGRRSLARPLGCWLGGLIASQTDWAPDFVVPVPLHRRRLAERGYNQAYLLARFTAQALHIPLQPLLVKMKAALPQSGLSYRRRKENIRGAFSCRKAPLPGKKALLVDDIYSTGSTMQEAAGVLCKQGLVVYGAVAAFTPRLT